MRDPTLFVTPTAPGRPSRALPHICRGGDGRAFYRCTPCGGWIEGPPDYRPIDTIGGRAELTCRRCGSLVARV